MQRGTTLVELTVAMAILAVVFAAIMPVFAAVRNHADAAGAASEMVQNARILNEQVYRHLAGAKRLLAMSGSTVSDGYIEFETSDGAVQRCQRGSSGWVEFGPVGDLSELAGPVQYLKFVCYDGNDPAIQTSVPGHVRVVTWEARLDSAGTLAEDKIIHGACYLRVSPGSGSTQANAAYDFATGRQGIDCFAYAGEGKPHVPTTVTTPSTPLNSGQYDAIEVQDGSLYLLTVSANSNYAQTRFVFTVREDKSTVRQITATWRGKGVNSHPSSRDGSSLYVWDYASSAYELLQASGDTEALITLTGTRSATPARYFGGSGDKTLVLLVVSNDDKKSGGHTETLYTDYVRLDLTSASGAVLP